MVNDEWKDQSTPTEETQEASNLEDETKEVKERPQQGEGEN
jgi:hypothetical protein